MATAPRRPFFRRRKTCPTNRSWLGVSTRFLGLLPYVIR